MRAEGMAEGSIEHMTLTNNVKVIAACEEMRLPNLRSGRLSMAEMKKLSMTILDAGVTFPLAHQQVGGSDIPHTSLCSASAKQVCIGHRWARLLRLLLCQFLSAFDF